MRYFTILILSVLTLISCSLEQETPNATVYFLPAEDVTAGDTITVGDTANFVVTYRMPSNCYVFNGFQLEAQGHSRTVAVKAVLFDDNNCVQDYDNLSSVPFDFIPTESGIYQLKFWSGDESGISSFIEKEVVVESTN